MMQHATPPRFGTQPIDDEIDAFWAERPRRTPPATARITCAACDRPATIPVTAAGRLCDLCREDLELTLVDVLATWDRAVTALREATERFDADVAHADEQTQARYARVVAARQQAFDGALSQASFQQRYSEALARGDALSALLRAEQALAQLGEATREITTKCWRAKDEIEVARDAK